eukprot:TRINITY_DN10109_c0_g1_i1.p1 TRINITY_DN10109_c0_g1~~TRINITY_DN10109_c0_g1_i1.p1  ORF type:complete len:402 (-),score=71.69 TRINITY_DN10109_c0_g1_i1:39-1244(-)
MALNPKAVVSLAANSQSIPQYRICEVPLKNLQGWKNYLKFKNESRKFIEITALGLLVHPPELINSGEGGAYQIRGQDGNLIAVFKPFDEDPYSLRNPKALHQPLLSISLPNVPTRSFVRPGESAQKEVAAYLLDRKNQAGVPLTTLVRMFGIERWGPEGKVGSLQSYVSHDHDSWELSSSLYHKNDVHSIALLDLRILNLDRHGGNVLVRRSQTNNNPTGETPSMNIKLIPIDHGFCLPDSHEREDLWFEWMSWPQAKLSVDSRLRKYVREIDLEEDATLLRGLGLREESVRTMLFCSVMLQQALLKGLSPLQIAEFLCKKQVTDFIPKNEEMLKVMRYRTEEILQQSWAPSSPPKHISIDPLELRERYRRQNSAPHLAVPLMTVTCGHSGLAFPYPNSLG